MFARGARVTALIFLTSVMSTGRVGGAGAEDGVVAEFDVKIPMRDGVLLSADIYRPAGEGRYPVILERTPYNNYNPEAGYYFARRGYAVVLQDVRGKHDSEGQFYPYVNEAADGYDTQAWCAAQPWSSGRIGTSGSSYVGATQVLPFIQGSRYLTCMVPQMAAVDIYHHGRYDGGAFALGINTTWGALAATSRVAQNPLAGVFDWRGLLLTLPVGGLPGVIGTRSPWYADWLAHPAWDQYWDSFSVAGKYDRVTAPSLNIGGWYDVFIQSTLEFFTEVSARGGSGTARRGQRLVVGPWTHTSPTETRIGQLDFGPAASLDVRAEQLRWYDYWLKDIDSGAAKEPRVKLFVMGENRWREFTDWPPEGTDTLCLYLRSGGRAASLLGDGRLEYNPPSAVEKPDSYTYDPSDPVPTLGGTNSGLQDIAPGGPCDQRPLERRPDILVYTGAPLEKPLTVIGPVRVVLWVSSSAVNTDFTAKLVDVHPDGRAINVSEGMLRAPLRNGFDRWEELEPGRFYELTVQLHATANRFERGHRLRLDISSSDFPRYDRNLNTPGADISRKTDMVSARQTVLHEPLRASRLILCKLD